ncbi:MAG: hypothetical protein JSS58_04470, partial [Proteobacteria bacterium]|nr:hypothetical protein [Pseudomonadota bacterium]
FSFLLRHDYIVAVAVNAGVATEGKDTPAEAVLPVAEPLADDPTTIRIVKDFMTTTAQTYLGLLGAGIIQRIERAKTAEQLLAVLGQWNMALHESTQGRRFAAGSLQQVKDALMGQGSFVPADARVAGKALQS